MKPITNSSDFWYGRINKHPEDASREEVWKIMKAFAEQFAPQQPSKAAEEEVYVECEDDPTEDGIYFVVDENGARFADRWIQGKWYSYPIHPIKYWLKKLTRPTVSEEEIVDVLLDIISDDVPTWLLEKAAIAINKRLNR